MKVEDKGELVADRGRGGGEEVIKAIFILRAETIATTVTAQCAYNPKLLEKIAAKFPDMTERAREKVLNKLKEPLGLGWWERAKPWLVSNEHVNMPWEELAFGQVVYQSVAAGIVNEEEHKLAVYPGLQATHPFSGRYLDSKVGDQVYLQGWFIYSCVAALLHTKNNQGGWRYMWGIQGNLARELDSSSLERWKEVLAARKG